jgi:RNA polymerase sigma factor
MGGKRVAYRFHFLPKKPDNDGKSILDTLNMIKNGNAYLKNKFIGDYKPFIKKVIKKTTGLTGYIEDSDEYSIALIAFNEAIDCYDKDKNFNFISFAEQVIRRRIIDYIRLNSRKSSNELPFACLTDTDNNQVDQIYLKYKEHSGFERIEIIQEMKKLVILLQGFDINIKDLPNYTPKRIDARELSLKIASTIANNKDLMKKLTRKKSIPTADVVKVFDVHPKTVQRHKEYIIALCLILSHELEHLKGFIGDERRRVTSGE